MLIVLDHDENQDLTATIVDSFVLRHTDLREFAARLLHDVSSVVQVRIYVNDRGRGDPVVDTAERREQASRTVGQSISPERRAELARRMSQPANEG